MKKKKLLLFETAKISHSPCILDHLVTVCKLSDLSFFLPRNHHEDGGFILLLLILFLLKFEKNYIYRLS